jgi:hypothetical protein
MTATARLRPAPEGLEKLLTDLEGKYGKPDPANIALGAERFEHILNSIIVPFVGLNAFLAGGITLHDLYPDHLVLLVACNLSAALILASWMYFRRNQPNPFPVLFFSAVPTFLLAGFLGIRSPAIALVLALVVTYAFAALVYLSKLSQRSVPVYVIYLPILLNNLQTDQGYRIATELLTLVPLGILFIHRRFRVATSAIVVSAVVTASLENPGQRGVTALVILLFLLVAVGIWYEIRIPKTDYSPLRAILDQGLLVLLAYSALQAVGFKSDDTLTWTWAIAVTVYEGIQCWREKLVYPTRIGVAAISPTIALWTISKPIPASIPIGGALLIAGLTNLATLRLGSSLLSNIGFVLLIPGTVKIYQLGDRSLSATVLVLGSLTTVAALLIARRPPVAASRPWWHGFIKENHFAWVKKVLLTVAGSLLRLPFAAVVFNIFRSCFLWLRYFKGQGNHFGLTDIFYILAHSYGAMILSRQAQLLAAVRNASIDRQLMSATTVWVLWGLAIFSIGIRKRTIYQRFVGLLFMVVPCVLYFPSLNESDASWALVSMLVGGAFWIVGVLREIRQNLASEEEHDGKGSEDLTASNPATV